MGFSCSLDDARLPSFGCTPSFPSSTTRNCCRSSRGLPTWVVGRRIRFLRLHSWYCSLHGINGAFWTPLHDRLFPHSRLDWFFHFVTLTPGVRVAGLQRGPALYPWPDKSVGHGDLHGQSEMQAHWNAGTGPECLDFSPAGNKGLRTAIPMSCVRRERKRHRFADLSMLTSTRHAVGPVFLRLFPSTLDQRFCEVFVFNCSGLTLKLAKIFNVLD